VDSPVALCAGGEDRNAILLPALPANLWHERPRNAAGLHEIEYDG